MGYHRVEFNEDGSLKIPPDDDQEEAQAGPSPQVALAEAIASASGDLSGIISLAASVRAYFAALMAQGFTDEDALMLTASYQAVAMQEARERKHQFIIGFNGAEWQADTPAEGEATDGP